MRHVAAAASTTTMAVYTHFDGMPGLWLAVRERSFGAVEARLRGLRASDDAVADLIASGAAYVDAALADQALFLVLFEVRRTETQPAAAASTFAVLIGAVSRAVASGRLHPDVDRAHCRHEILGDDARHPRAGVHGSSAHVGP